MTAAPQVPFPDARRKYLSIQRKAAEYLGYEQQSHCRCDASRLT